MRVISHGVDIVEVDRVEDMLARHKERFTQRVFTRGELEHSHGRRARAQHLAARFAAKEAVLKALGTGLAAGVTWQDVEILTQPSGQPFLRLANQAERIALVKGVQSWSVSLSHTRHHAVASVIALG